MTFDSADSLIRSALELVLDQGTEYSPRDQYVLEISRPTVLTLTDVHKPFMASPIRKANYRFGMAEAAWILSGTDSATLIGQYNRRMMLFSDDGEKLWGAYGPRLMGQLNHVLSVLRRDTDSRQAITTTWRPQVGPMCGSMLDAMSGPSSVNVSRMRAAGLSWHGSTGGGWDGSSWRSKDIPCTVAWHFQIRSGKLNLTVFMRSNDVWLGLPYDILSFTTVQRVVASCLGVESGEYHHVVSNLHIYEQHLDKARAVCDEHPNGLTTVPSFEDRFYGMDSDALQATWWNSFVPTDQVKCHPVDEFRALIFRDPTLWDEAEALMRSNGRSLRPKKD